MSHVAVRRTSLATLSVVLVLLLAIPAFTAPAAAASDDLVLAAESTEPVGPEPAPYDDEENAAVELGNYDRPSTPFTWAVAWLLTGGGLLGIVAIALFYRTRVARRE